MGWQSFLRAFYLWYVVEHILSGLDGEGDHIGGFLGERVDKLTG